MTVKEEEQDIITPEQSMSAAEVLEEQKRLEDEALRLALPRQAAEADALEAEWRQGAGAGVRLQPTAPVEYAQGTVMPTSKGFMYVGNPLQAPDPSTPLGTQREFESAVMRQSAPAAASAAAGLETMGLMKPGEFIGLPRQHALAPISSPAEAKYAAQQEYLSAIDRGVTPDEAMKRYGWMMFAGQRGGPFAPMTTYQQTQTTLRERELAMKDAAARARQEASVTKPQQAVLGQEILSLEGTIRKAEQDLAANPPVDPSDKRQDLIDRWRSDLEALKSQHKSVSGRPLVAPPTTTGTSKGKLTKEMAKEFLRQANGDRAKAEQMATRAGYTF